MDEIEVCTLIDITNTKVHRLSQGTELELNQQRNFTTLIQCLEIRSVIAYTQSPTWEIKDIKNSGYGTEYKGKQQIWKFKFTTDRQFVYQDNDGDPIGLLIEDMHEVPIIKKLTESINISKPIFDCKDPKFRNTIVNFISH